jgi:small conductance mechanosensitive channel
VAFEARQNYNAPVDEFLDTIWNGLMSIGPRLIAAVAIFAASWIAGSVAKGLIRRAIDRMDGTSRQAGILLAGAAKILLLIVGLITALGTMRVNISALVAGLGLGGFALGFALKDTLSNTLAGFLVLLHKPFKVGDEITVAGCTGVVVEMNLRYTVLQSGQKTCLIPNGSLYTNTITIDRPPSPAADPTEQD